MEICEKPELPSPLTVAYAEWLKIRAEIAELETRAGTDELMNQAIDRERAAE